jgi:DNA topoisomerase-2
MNVPLVQIHEQLRKALFDEATWPKLMDIKTYQYTREEVEKLVALIEKRQTERAALKATSVVQLWKNNLGEI